MSMPKLSLNGEDKAIIEKLKELERDKYMKPKTCLVCGTPIEQGYSGQRRRYCERAGCRRRGARLLKIIQRQEYEAKTIEKMREFAQDLTPDSVSQLEFLLNSSWTSQHVDHGAVYNRSIDVVDMIMQMIDRERQAAWTQVELFTAVTTQRATRAKERIDELEEELDRLRPLLPEALHKAILSKPRYVSADTHAGRAPGEAARLDRRSAARLLLPQGHSQDNEGDEGDGEE